MHILHTLFTLSHTPIMRKLTCTSQVFFAGLLSAAKQPSVHFLPAFTEIIPPLMHQNTSQERAAVSVYLGGFGGRAPSHEKIPTASTSGDNLIEVSRIDCAEKPAGSIQYISR